MDVSDPEEKTFPPAEDSGDISSSERQQQKFQLTPEQRRFLGTRSFQNGVAATGHGTGKARNDVTAHRCGRRRCQWSTNNFLSRHPSTRAVGFDSDPDHR